MAAVRPIVGVVAAAGCALGASNPRKDRRIGLVGEGFRSIRVPCSLAVGADGDCWGRPGCIMSEER